MTITLTWHLIMMLIISIIFVLFMAQQAFEHGDWAIMTIIPIFLVLCLIWGIYGGIVWW